MRTAACAILLTFVAIPPGGAEHGGDIWSVSEPVVDPNPVREGDIATVSFTITMDNHPPCRTPPAWQVHSPVCLTLLGWRISLNGDFAAEEATPLAANHYVYNVHEHAERDGYVTELHVKERVVMNAPPGDHTLRLHVVEMLDVPVQRISSGGLIAPFLPCGSETVTGLYCEADAVYDKSINVLRNPMMPALQ